MSKTVWVNDQTHSAQPVMSQTRQHGIHEPTGSGNLQNFHQRSSPHPLKAMRTHDRARKPPRDFPMARSPKLNMGHSKNRQPLECRAPAKKVTGRQFGRPADAGNARPSRQSPIVNLDESRISRTIDTS
ncbi:unnamed protein product [Linum trigynum]|uniref:Uncharacterized protein n=1 Tax=Linum trigynum TaxID=586398 RepID=A0AAV2E4X8_9ROSI